MNAEQAMARALDGKFFKWHNSVVFDVRAAKPAEPKPQRDWLIVGTENEVITLASIKQVVSCYFSIPVAEIVAVGQGRSQARARQAAAYLARKYLGTSFPRIGRALGGRDHSTIIYSCEKVEKRAHLFEPELSRCIAELQRKSNSVGVAQ